VKKQYPDGGFRGGLPDHSQNEAEAQICAPAVTEIPGLPETERRREPSGAAPVVLQEMISPQV